MSQSDYIEFKKTQNLLYNLKSASKILTSREYTRFKQYAIETSVVNTLPQLNQLIPASNTIIFDMNVKVNCSQLRENLLNTGSSIVHCRS